MTAKSAPPKTRRMPAGSTESVPYKTLVDSAPLGILFVNPLGCIDTINAKLIAILGLNPDDTFLAENIFSVPALADSGIAAAVQQCLDCLEPACLERRFETACPETVHLRCHLTPVFDTNNHPCGVQAIVEDISESKRIDHPIRRASAIEEIGTLAGGIAHDFNNMLWMILGNTELAAAEIPPGHSARYNLEQVEDACRRAQELVMQILRFSRDTEHDRIPVKVSAVVEQSLRHLEPSISKGIEIHQHISTSDDTILADITKINQLVNHLLTNATYAMGQTGGVLEISVEDVVLGDEEVLPHGNLVPGKYVILTVMDTGPGIAPEISHRIFDPFFSTKSPTQHSGMGLAIVNSIVNSHGGTLTVQSEPGKGAIFHVILPTIEAEPTPVKYTAPPVSDRNNLD